MLYYQWSFLYWHVDTFSDERLDIWIPISFIGEVFLQSRVKVRVIMFNASLNNISMPLSNEQHILAYIRFVINLNSKRGRIGRECMVVGFITTYKISVYHKWVVSSNPGQGGVYSIQLYVIKFISDLRQVVVFFGYSWFPPPIKLTPTI
jgi:hypothetical protein